ncbi:MAG: amino acid ABC transporter permease [Synechococcaceae cyanobacterium SM2_3_1]|nr:amino acid ABC transporter permease [Synechococcaceae cyanobacterium SM2_3_1]
MTAFSSPEQDLRPPTPRLHPILWLRKNLFGSWFNSLLTLFSLAILVWTVFGFVHWAQQANWAVIPANLKIFASGTYPVEQLWRVWVVLGMVMAILGMAGGAWQGVLRQYTIGVAVFFGILALFPLGSPQFWLAGIAAVTALGVAVGWKRQNLQLLTLWIWVPVLPLVFELLLGGFGEQLPGINSSELSGLLLTLIMASAALIIAFPIGVLLALGRANGNLPVIKIFSIGVIEFFRGIPLTTILFAAWLLVPLFLGGASVDILIRVEVGFILFTAVYVAEDVRGGLQSIPRGQWEAARALGLNPLQLTWLIILPQALRVAIPSLVNAFLTLFKDTSLVIVVGAIDLLQAGRIVYNNSNWLGTQQEVLFFIGLVYFCFCYAMAHAAKQIERSLGLGER